MMNELPKSLQEVPWLSPSRYWSLKSCFLKFGLDSLRPSYEQRISNPAAILGTIAHYVLEQAGKITSPLQDAAAARVFCEQKWAEELGKQLEYLRNRAFDSHLLKPESWPNYFLQKARAIRLATSLIVNRVPGGSGGTQPLIETKIEAQSLKIRGRLDRVEFGPDGACLIDWKSSLQSEDGEISDQYRSQLLLYAGIYHEQFKEWPTKARLVTFAGEQLEFAIDPKESEQLIRQALNLLETFNCSIKTEIAQTLARPSSDACNFCDYRGFCSAYWQNRPSIDSIDIEGRVTACSMDQNKDRWSLSLRQSCSSGLDEDIEIVNLDPVQFFYLAALSIGQHVRVINLYGSAANTRKYFTSSRSYIVI